MALEKTTAAIKKFFEKIGKRNLIIASAVVLVGVAICLNIIFFSGGSKDGFGGYDKSTGMDGGQNAGVNTPETADAAASYFSATQISRERARDEALEVLQTVADNKEASAEVKAQALGDIGKLALEAERESKIESLVLAKGFEQCVAVLNGDSANIVVKAPAELTPAELARINEIVYSEAGIDPVNIKIIRK